MPRPPETPDVRASKTLAYICRHGAEKEQLHIRSDGFLKLNDVLARPKMRDIDLEMVLRLVAENAKQRFELFYGYDPSPPPPKKKGNQGKSKSKAKQVSVPQDVQAATPGTAASSTQVDAAAVDDIRHDLAKTGLDPPGETRPTELPLVSLPQPGGLEPGSETTEPRGEWFIRATQGHSIQLESTAHLEHVIDDQEGRERVGLMVHGTRWELWDLLKRDGLKKMSRQHVHLAPALKDHRITPRPSSTLLIYLDLQKVLDAGIPVYTSLNGVVLTPGEGEEGTIKPHLWAKAERKVGSEWQVVWADGVDVEQRGPAGAVPGDGPPSA